MSAEKVCAIPVSRKKHRQLQYVRGVRRGVAEFRNEVSESRGLAKQLAGLPRPKAGYRSLRRLCGVLV